MILFHDLKSQCLSDHFSLKYFWKLRLTRASTYQNMSGIQMSSLELRGLLVLGECAKLWGHTPCAGPCPQGQRMGCSLVYLFIQVTFPFRDVTSLNEFPVTAELLIQDIFPQREPITPLQKSVMVIWEWEDWRIELILLSLQRPRTAC